MNDTLKREPAFWIGLGVTVLIAVVQALNGQGLISDTMAGNVTDGARALGQLLTILAPLVAGVLIRSRVTPTAAPSLPQGTTVTVVTPPGSPDTTTVLQ